MEKELIDKEIGNCCGIIERTFQSLENNPKIKKWFFNNTEEELKQFLAEYTLGVLKIVNGDNSLTITELIKGQSRLLHEKINRKWTDTDKP